MQSRTMVHVNGYLMWVKITVLKLFLFQKTIGVLYVFRPKSDVHLNVHFVQQVDKLKFDVQKSLDETQVLFDSLVQEYFGKK